MSKIDVKVVLNFREQDVVLVAMDRAGLKVFRSAISAAAIQKCGTTLEFKADRIVQFISIEHGGAEIDISENAVVWHLSLEKLAEVLEKLDAMQLFPSPCHHYLDIQEPTKALCLSVDE